MTGRQLLHFLPMLAVVALAIGAAAAPQAPLPVAYEPLPAHELEERLHELVLAEREREGLAPLEPSGVLALASRHHAAEMVSLGYFAHESPRAENATTRMRVGNAGGAMMRVGENLAQLSPMTDDFAERTVRGWMESEEHRDNLLGDAWTHVGYGLEAHPDGRTFVVQVFASEPNPLRDVTALNEAGGALRLTFEHDPAELIVLVDEVPVEVEVDGTSLVVSLPAGDPPRSVMIGRSLGDGRIEVVQGFEVRPGLEFAPLPP